MNHPFSRMGEIETALDNLNRNGGESGPEVPMNLNRFNRRVVLVQDLHGTWDNG
jgi:hypothetical protein